MNTHSTAPFLISVSGEADLPDLGDVTAVISIRDPHDDVRPPYSPRASPPSRSPSRTPTTTGRARRRPGTCSKWNASRAASRRRRLHVHLFRGRQPQHRRSPVSSSPSSRRA